MIKLIDQLTSYIYIYEWPIDWFFDYQKKRKNKLDEFLYKKLKIFDHENINNKTKKIFHINIIIKVKKLKNIYISIYKKSTSKWKSIRKKSSWIIYYDKFQEIFWKLIDMKIIIIINVVFMNVF